MARPSYKIEWDAHEYEHKERNQDWFWAVGIITISIAVVAVILGNVIFAILIIIGAISLSIFINRPPETLHVVIDERGITRGNVRYPYDTLDSFWIDVDHPHKKIILKSQKLLMPLIIVPFDDNVNPDRLEIILARHLKVEYHSLPFVEKVLEYLGF
jgi:hypothetical protein